MKSVGAFEAKTHLNQLLQRAFNGEIIQITRRGVPMARLVPPTGSERKDISKIANDMRQLRKGVSLKNIAIQDLINEGRRH